MKACTRISFSAFFVLSSFFSALAGDMQVYDVFTNKAFSFRLLYKEQAPELIRAADEFSIEYFSFDTPYVFAAARIDAEIYSLAAGSLQSQSFMMQLAKEAEQRAGVYENLKYSRNNSQGEEENDYRLSLQSVKCKPVSVVAGLLWFVLLYEFEIKEGYSSNDVGFTIKRYYTADLSTGMVKPATTKLNVMQLESVSRKLSAKMNERYALITSKLSRSDMMEEEEYNSNEESSEESMDETKPAEKKEQCKDICEKINLNEADFYWYGWGLMISFQGYTSNSEIFYGKSFDLFLPLDDAKEVASLLPGFDFVASLNEPFSEIKKFNYYDFLNKFNFGRIPATVSDVLALNPPRSVPKTLTVESYQLFDNDKRNFRGTFTHKFNSRGQLVFKRFADREEKNYEIEYFEYDSLGRLYMQNSKFSDGDEVSEAYEYDRKGNLLLKETISDERVSTHCFFYNGNMVYSFTKEYVDAGDEEPLSQLVIGSNEFCGWGICYLMKDGKVQGVKSAGHSSYEIQVGYDEKGRLTESHMENDRNNYYFYYDLKNRFVKQDFFEHQAPRISVQFYYENDSPFPYRQTKTTFSGNIRELETYKWEFF